MRVCSSGLTFTKVKKFCSTAWGSGDMACMNKARQCCWLPAKIVPKRSVMSPRSGATSRSEMEFCRASSAYLLWSVICSLYSRAAMPPNTSASVAPISAARRVKADLSFATLLI
jgi:predicted MarR family transcription regulator